MNNKIKKIFLNIYYVYINININKNKYKILLILLLNFYIVN